MPIRVDGMQAGYGRSTVLHDLSMEIPSGSITSILGANGAGKTTLLRCLSGLLHARAGTIDFDGLRLETLQPPAIVAAGIAHVPEGRQLFFDLTVEQNLKLGRYAAARGGPDESKRLELVFRYFPRVEQRRMQLAGTLSGGEQQMVAIGRALMGRPDLLLLDEPSLGLAPKVVGTIMATLRGLKDGGLTILLVEQNAKLALEIADRGYIMRTGAIVLEDLAENLRKDSALMRIYLGMS